MAKIYLISPEDFNLSIHQEKLEAAFKTGKVSAFQLRIKDQDIYNIEETAVKTLEICQKFNVLFIINDNLDLAIKIKAGGAHLGIDDYKDLSIIRKVAPRGFIIGTSCYDSRDMALDSVINNVDYISFGAFYPSKTKKSRGNPDIDILKWADELFEVPIVAIGGIDDKNSRRLVNSGADFVAVITYFWEHDSSSGAIENLYKSIN